MKKKFLLRVLSCLLACTLVLETPAQAFAAQITTGVEETAADDEQKTEESSSEEEALDNSEASEEAAETTNPEETAEPEAPAESGTPEETVEPEAPAESETPEETEEPEAPEEAAEPEAPAESETPEETVEPEAPAESEVPEETVEPETPAEPENPGIEDEIQAEETVEEPVEALAVDTKDDEFTVDEAPQYGKKPGELISDEVAEAWIEVRDRLKSAMSGENMGIADLKEYQVTPDLLKGLIYYELNQKTYENMLPSVSYSYENGSGYKYVQMVQFAHATSPTLTVETRTANSTTLRLSGLVSGATSYQLLRRSETEENVAVVSASQSGTLFTDNTAGVHDYTYIVYACVGDKIVGYSSMAASRFAIAAPTGVGVTLNNPKSATVKWTAPVGVQNYTIYRDGTAAAALAGNATSWTDTNVSAGTNHTYRIIAYTAVNGESRHNETTVELKWDKGLTKPSVSVTSEAGDRVVLSWNAVSGAAGYLIYQVSGSNYQLLKDTSSASQTFTGLDAGKNYQYVVLPYRKSGEQAVYGNLSDVVNARPKLAKVTLSAKASAYNKIQLSWNERSGASGYNIYRQNSSGKYVVLKKITTGSTTSYTDTGLTLNKSYSYKIVPFRTADGKDYEGNESNVASAKTALTKAKISSVKGTDDKTIKITWKKVAGAKGYEIYRSTSSKSGFKLVKRTTSGSSLSYSNSGLSLGKTYYYKVRAYRTVSGKKVYGAWSSVVKGQTTLKTVKSLKVKAEDYTTMKLTWKKVDKADKYQIYYATSKDGTYKKLATVSDTEYTYKKPTCGQTYYFKVRAMKTVNGKNGYGNYSAVVSQMTKIKKTALRISNAAYNSITLEWDEVTGAQKYEIYGSTSKDGTYKSLGTTKNTSFTHKNLELEKTYYYKVRAIRQKYTTAFTTVKNAKTTLGKLTGLEVTKYYDGTLKITWDKVEGATSYQVYRSTDEDDDDEYKRIASVTANSYIDSDVSSSKTYYYKVCGLRGDAKTNLAGPVSAKSSKESKGIDVSSYQGTIDWKKVKNDGIDFAMIRIVTGSSSSTERDSKFKENYDGARNNGIKVGVYRYSYATSRTKAREEAHNVIDALNGRKLDYPIVMDVEDSSILSATDSNARRTEIILAFKDVVEDAGYKFALYANTTWLNNYLDMDQLKDVDIWVARWRDYNLGHGYNGKGNVTMWQYSGSGKVDGISGKVDLNVSYKDY